jgi:hypothetical protein
VYGLFCPRWYPRRRDGRHALQSKYNASHAGVTMTDYEKSRGTKFGAMPFLQKITWTLKFIVALCTFGFVYPNIMHD